MFTSHLGAQRPLRLFAFLPLLLATTACPGSLDNPGDFGTGGNGTGTGSGSGTGSGGGSPGADPVCDGLLTRSCATAACHVAGKTSPDLGVAGREDRVRDVPGNVCDGVLADTAAPEESLIYTKTSSDPACGSRMPQVGDALDEEERACLLAWIESL